ncbi:MAG: efflux RND transporter periplasmic adaptor subunit [Woeseiaceae bacterium]|nr:efflux RND transporter periplasmic adaptor subunit [Woeseiaceae bacterium]
MLPYRLPALLVSLCLPALAPAAVPVTVAPLDSRLIDLPVRAPATVVAANEAVIAAQVSGLISEVRVDVGARVDRGDLLVLLDPDDARLALARAEADLAALDAQIEQAAQRLARGENLKARDFISEDDLLDRETTLNVLRANRSAQELAVRTARLALSRTRIVAPYAATVVARSAQVGSLAQPGTPLLTLVQTGDREVDADLDPRLAATLADAPIVRFVSRGRDWPLTLLRLSDVIDTEARIRKGRFAFSGEPAAIGTSGEVVWIDAASLVPVPLIVQRDGRLGVFVADSDRARFVPLPGAQEGRPARTGLPGDTLIVVRGHTRLQDGDSITTTRE